MPFKISLLKNVIPTKSYSLVMLHLLNTMYLSCTIPMTSRAIGSYFSNLKLFSTFMQYMRVSHGYSTMGGKEYDGRDYYRQDKKEKVSHR